MARVENVTMIDDSPFKSTDLEKKDVMYRDPYFDREDGLIQSFELDRESLIKFRTKVEKNDWFCCMFSVPHFWFISPFLMVYPLFLVHNNVVDNVNAQHVCVTRDGIKFVVERHRAGCRFACDDVGRRSTTIPFDKITDCDVVEPAGSSGPICCLTKNILSSVVIDTSSGRTTQIAGLKKPYEFKKLVWAMKRGEAVSQLAVASALSGKVNRKMSGLIGMGKHDDTERGGEGQNEESLPLLRQLNAIQSELLETQKAVLEQLTEQTQLLKKGQQP